MLRYKGFIISILIIIITIAFISEPVYPSSHSYLNISAKSAIAIESTTGKVLFRKNDNMKLPMASTTKIMTAIIVIENCDLEKEISIPDEAIGVHGSSIYLEKGEKLKIIELLYGLMLASGNDAAVALAIATCGSVKKFVDMMNQKAKLLNLKNTRFSSPHGLEQGEHFTTAEDLARLSAYAMKNPIFQKIVSTKEKEIRWTTREYNRKLKNKNKMLNQYEGADGIKTGFTRKAGRCLVTSAIKNDFRIICVVLNAPDMWNDTKKILDYAYTNYQIVRFKKGEIGYLKINLSKKKWIKIGIDKDINTVISKDDSPRIEMKFKKDINAPLKKHSSVGALNLLLRSEKYSFPVYSYEEAKRKTIIDKIKDRINLIRK